MDIKSKIKKIPETSGVYFFKDKNKKIIYIGKANSLKNRVSSYFSKTSKLMPKIKNMVREIEDIEYIPTCSEVEAIILECKMIKKNNPYYNTQLKDDKSFPYIKITIEKDFPQILFYRKTKQKIKKDKSIYFGPFVDSEATRIVIKLLRQIFKIRGCKKEHLKKEDICLDYQLGLCSAPCAHMIDKIEYQKMVREACLFLSGKQKKLLKELYREMKRLSVHLNYERAAKVRDKIRSIKEIFKDQKVNFYNKEKNGEYVLKKIEELEVPGVRKGKQAIIDLKEKLKLKMLPETIEAFDISNIQGKLSVGSMVVFKNGKPDKGNYRRYKIKTIKQADDYAMLQEVIKRRYERLISEKKEIPDLLLVDGGKGQLNAIKKVLELLNLNLPIITIAKKEEEIFKPGVNKSIRLPSNSEALFLLQRIRDEAHRFAITYHRRIRNKELHNSKLDLIPGIGDKRKKLLLKNFKNIEEIKNASIKEISKVPGFGEKIANTIKIVLEVRG